MLAKLTDSDLMLDTGTTVICPSKSVRDLGVHLDSELTMKTHILKVVSCCYHQLRRIGQVRRLVGQDVAQQLVSSFILWRIDYCNSLPLQRVMNAQARVIMNLSLCDHVKPALTQLHWLPVEQRIIYKLCLFMHHIHAIRAPQYLSDCVSTVSALGGRYRLRSTGSADYVLPKTRTKFGERGFSYLAQLPGALFLLISTTLQTLIRLENDSRVYFLIMLTTDYCWRSWTCRIAAPYKFYVD